jgi:hypothetical protein
VQSFATVKRNSMGSRSPLAADARSSGALLPVVLHS